MLGVLIPVNTWAQSSVQVKSAEASYLRFIAVAKSARSMKSILPYLSADQVSRYQQSMSWTNDPKEKAEKAKEHLLGWRDLANRYVRIMKGTKNKHGVILTLNVQKIRKDGRYPKPKSNLKYDEGTIQMVYERGR